MPEVAVFPEFGWQRCGKDARDPRHHARGPGAMPCAKWTLVVQVRGGVALCVDVTDEEHTRHRPCTSPGEVLAALGLTEWLGTA